MYAGSWGRGFCAGFAGAGNSRVLGCIVGARKKVLKRAKVSIAAALNHHCAEDEGLARKPGGAARDSLAPRIAGV